MVNDASRLLPEDCASESCEPGEITRLLREVRDGNRAALEEVMVLLYDELRRIARRQLSREYRLGTLEPTALVHEVYLRMVRAGRIHANHRAHLLRIAARAMRQVLVDHARRRKAVKREHARAEIVLGPATSTNGVDVTELLAIDAALEQLDPRQRQIVECRFFAGMSDEEIAAALGVSDRTVRREWTKARAWLNRALYGGE